MPQEILEPNEAEREWIEANLRVARTAIKTFAPDQGTETALEALDAAYAVWRAQHDPSREDPNPYINAFGIAFGQQFVDQLGFRWAVVKDGQSVEMAVLGAPRDGSGEVLVYPPNFVGKRYVSRSAAFFATTFDQMKRDIEHPPTTAAKRAWWRLWSRE